MGKSFKLKAPGSTDRQLLPQDFLEALVAYLQGAGRPSHQSQPSFCFQDGKRLVKGRPGTGRLECRVYTLLPCFFQDDSESVLLRTANGVRKPDFLRNLCFLGSRSTAKT